MKISSPNHFLNAINYWTPLTSQVEALDQHPPRKKTPNKKIKFTLPTTHRPTDGPTWRRKELQRIIRQHRPWKTTRMPQPPKHTDGMTKAQIKTGIMNGTIASACSDTGATSTAGKPNDPFKATNRKSTKVFHLPVGGTATATNISKLLLDVRAPANEVDIVPGLEQTFLSGSKFADAGYTAVYDQDEVNFYNSDTIQIDEASVLRGYRCPRTGLWRVPLQPIVLNENEDTLILDSPCGQTSSNTRYKVPSTEQVQEHLKASIE